ncbi:DUF4232 domain-containing protein [Streptomyces sp. NPDC058417]|uniref:DUF4232 domain-containing protein n=1 Tax=unclassified Streptomyces TaxID=2593676 RepID=UPI0036588A72
MPRRSASPHPTPAAPTAPLPRAVRAHRAPPVLPVPRAVRALPVLAVAALLLTACGSERAAQSGAGGDRPPSRTQVDDPGKDGVRITAVTFGADSASPSASPDRAYSVTADSLPRDEISAAYEVTNDSAETLTYTVVITFISADGGAMDNQTATVRDVGPGRTVRGTVRVGFLPPGTPRVTGARVLKVTKVPAGEAPAEPGTCPASGVQVTADQGDAAMGLRVVGLHLHNCGTRPYTVDGYPLLEPLDEDLRPVEGVSVLKGTGEITTGLGSDGPPRPVTLAPGESATADLAWRNTTGAGTAVNAPHVRVRAKAGADPVTVTPNLDLGTTGKLGVSPWKRVDPQGANAGG